MGQSKSIFERRWTEADGIELARQIAKGEVNPKSIDTMLGMGYYTGWFNAMMQELARLASENQKGIITPTH